MTGLSSPLSYHFLRALGQKSGASFSDPLPHPLNQSFYVSLLCLLTAPSGLERSLFLPKSYTLIYKPIYFPRLTFAERYISARPWLHTKGMKTSKMVCAERHPREAEPLTLRRPRAAGSLCLRTAHGQNLQPPHSSLPFIHRQQNTQVSYWPRHQKQKS